MAAFSRGLRSFSIQGEFVCTRCLQFSTTTAAQSGHNRWSKIKHDKGAADAKKNVQRSQFAREIALASKLYGGDPATNPRLTTILATAKKAGFPKASMDAAIARGQGKSATGAALENLTLEVIMPPSVACIIEVETDNKGRTMTELRTMIKKYNGNVSSISYLFEKKGRLAFEKAENTGVDEVLDEAIEAGAEDVEEDEDGSLIVWTSPSGISTASERLGNSFGLKVESTDIIWAANEETKVEFKEEESDAAKSLAEFLAQMQDSPWVQGIYANATQGTLADDIWASIQDNLDA